MRNQTNQKQTRQYDIDWLRILLIGSVFLYHIGMIFNSWDWHIKNDVTYGSQSALWYVMTLLGCWRMPLLILISGAGTYFALGRRTSWQFLKERFKRLFIPLVVGIFGLVPIQVYLEKSAEYQSLAEFYLHMFDGVYPEGNFSWHHLWFIAYLFFIAVLISPFLKFLRSNRANAFYITLEHLAMRRMGANIFLVPIVASQLLLRPYFPENTHALLDDWAALAYYGLFFLSGFLLIKNRRLNDRLRELKYGYLTEAIVASGCLFLIPDSIESVLLSKAVLLVCEAVVAWSWALTALGFARQYLNCDNRFRRIANEAIYPFYLLHQPVIVMVAYEVVQWDLALGWKALTITLLAFIGTSLIYWFLVRPYQLTRLCFGMKPLERKTEVKFSSFAIYAHQKQAI
ncbi:acyltransferase family protein [Sunxiuqinia elliptica]|uniref:Peptidoglycan/LPS O-acetylase OafA/YrhL, contains acyltransferase and SGNH-hydrolase domains n=1 Tax=Sunxiuqinia elliptica TaxID=655355 RepID=A0A1I2EDK4_9BACT|nr:acyltransferase family protein [Sunxiuqinia elliptica]SFE90799.1 Peptidoglycan/LPS O-acetylase OafA/YrhL, contains acyltransferase and SGNH-hydrolase domains [Sunxiuqinia elliptica]